MGLIVGLIIISVILAVMTEATDGLSLFPLVLALAFTFFIIKIYPFKIVYSAKEYKTEQVRTEIINGDTTVYFKIVKIEWFRQLRSILIQRLHAQHKQTMKGNLKLLIDLGALGDPNAITTEDLDSVEK